MRLPRMLFVLLMLLLTSRSVAAQPSGSRASGRVFGTITDTVSRQPILRSTVCRESVEPHVSEGVCVDPDSTGRFTMDKIPEGRYALWVRCEGLRGIRDRQMLRGDTLYIGAGLDTRFDVSTAAVTCDMRPLLVKRAIFRGLYQEPFEDARFSGCDGSTANKVFLSDAVRKTPRWPKPKSLIVPAYFVEWEGTLRGPWGAESRFELTVERVLSVRHPQKTDCGAGTLFSIAR